MTRRIVPSLTRETSAAFDFAWFLKRAETSVTMICGCSEFTFAGVSAFVLVEVLLVLVLTGVDLFGAGFVAVLVSRATLVLFFDEVFFDESFFAVFFLDEGLSFVFVFFALVFAGAVFFVSFVVLAEDFGFDFDAVFLLLSAFLLEEAVFSRVFFFGVGVAFACAFFFGVGVAFAFFFGVGAAFDLLREFWALAVESAKVSAKLINKTANNPTNGREKFLVNLVNLNISLSVF